MFGGLDDRHAASMGSQLILELRQTAETYGIDAQHITAMTWSMVAMTGVQHVSFCVRQLELTGLL